MRTAVYAGSFDPVTLGHMDVIRRSAALFDRVYVAVLNNEAKNCAFTLDERRGFIEKALAERPVENVSVGSFNGLLVDYMRSVGAHYIVRGIRNSADYDYECGIDAANKHLMQGAETVYFAADPRLAFVSSSIVREIAVNGGKLEGLVPAEIENIVAERLLRR